MIYGLYHKGKVLAVRLSVKGIPDLQSHARSLIPELAAPTTMQHIIEAMARHKFIIRRVKVTVLDNKPVREVAKPYYGADLPQIQRKK